MATRGGIGDLITEGFATALFGRRETMRIPVRTSSNQAEAIYLPTAAPGLGDSGVIIGREVYSGKGYIYDPFQLYGQQLPAPHWLVLGESGNGKSALEKTYVLRQLRFRDRQVVVLDAQGEDGVGEWNLIAEALGVKPIRLDPHARGGQGIRLNPLDPAITITGQLALLRTIVEVALGHTLDERSGYALKAAHGTVSADAAQANVQPILHDIVDALREPRPEAAAEMNIGLDDVREWGLDVALVIDRLVDGDLAGMFDGPTSDGIDLDSPLIVFDLSTIDRNSIAMPILMAIVGVWLEHTWLRPDRRKRILLVEEAWHIINQPSVAQLFQRLLKFGRRLGLSFVAVVHHLSDVIDGAAAKEAAAILKMASTRTIYMQKSDEARATGKVLGLPRWAMEIIPTLSPGIAVWDVNGDVQVVKHIVTEVEKPLVYTDRAMTESSPREDEIDSALRATLPPAPPALESAPRALPPTRAGSATRPSMQPSALQRARFQQQAQQQVQVEVEQVQPEQVSAEPLPPTAAPRLSAVRHPEPLQPIPMPEALPTTVAPTPLAAAPTHAVLEPVVRPELELEPEPESGPQPQDDPFDDEFDDESYDGVEDENSAVPTPSAWASLLASAKARAAELAEPIEPAEPVVVAKPTEVAEPAEPAESAEPVAEPEPPIPAAPALRPVAPPAVSAVSRPSVDDPELTALAAALFGPRAQTPSHPRRVDDERERER
jgi:hypothetical protein